VVLYAILWMWEVMERGVDLLPCVTIIQELKAQSPTKRPKPKADLVSLCLLGR